MKNAFLAAMVVASLAACGDNSSGVGAGTGAEGSDKDGFTIRKGKTITASQDAAITVKMPAQALIADGLFSAGGVVEKGRLARQKGFKVLGVPGFDMWPLFAKASMDSYKDDPSFLDKEGSKVSKKTAALIKSGDVEKLTEVYRHGDYLSHIAACISPVAGWEVSPIDNRKKAEEYMRYIASACDFTTAIFTQMGAKIGPKVLRDPDEAKEKVEEAFEETSLNYLESAWNSAVEDNKLARFIPNLTGVSGIQFQGPGGVYANEGYGFVVKKSGITWFGEGHLSGKSVEFALASAISTKAEKSKEIGISREGGVSGRTGADVGVK